MNYLLWRCRLRLFVHCIWPFTTLRSMNDCHYQIVSHSSKSLSSLLLKSVFSLCIVSSLLIAAFLETWKLLIKNDTSVLFSYAAILIISALALKVGQQNNLPLFPVCYIALNPLYQDHILKCSALIHEIIFKHIHCHITKIFFVLYVFFFVNNILCIKY